MATLEQIIDQMSGAGLPPLPSGHPVIDGKIHRFGREKKAWYVLRELDLRNSKRVITGSFGLWRGDDNNAVPVSIDWGGITAEERAEAERKQAEHQRAEAEQKQRDAEMAANRARMAWGDADSAADVEQHPYLERKRVGCEGTRVDAKGQLLVPARKYSTEGAVLAGLQKIAADGSKRFSSGMDMIGASCLLGKVNQDSSLIEVGEGYATCETSRMATGFDTPVMVAFNAGNLMAVAQQLRRDFPNAHLLFLADDDARIVARLREALLKDFEAEWEPVIDGADHEIEAKTGDIVRVRATWRSDATGTDYIEADIRAGRQIQMRKFENAGVSRSRAAARAVGNASVVIPQFASRAADSKDSDFNDLYLAETLDVVRAQILDARSRALTIAQAPAAEADADEPPAYLDDVPMAETPADQPSEAPGAVRIPTLEVLISHFSLIYPTTDVWDSLRKQRLKKSAFAAWVGKELADSWNNDPKRRTILRDSLPTLIGGKAVEGGAGGGKLGEMLDNLTLLRGTETVWDGIGQQVMTLGAVRADYTAELTSKWQEHAQRKTIEARNLVFDPTQTADPVSHVNIFLGWPLSPKENDKLVEPILALLASLCDAEDKVAECVEWILRWLAYPLQHPGAKMQTALLMFGEKQGTGKSLFFQDVMLPIYGDYGTVASQHQLDSSFTAWRSRKLFVLFEEVLSRDDKYSHNGTLKYMITGKTMSINQKNLPERDERNHMNSAFLSNEPQPIPIELEDRRFMVIEARRKQDPDFYAEVQRSIVAGGIEAFYHFLLNLPLDDFNEHTKPPMTLAKERVIEFGLAGWMSFHRAWKDGCLDAPYCSCLSEDLYIIYKRWCDKSGEKPLTLCKFAGLIASREHKAKKSVAVESKHKKTRMVFVVENPDHPEDLEAQIAKFRKLVDVRADRALQG